MESCERSGEPFPEYEIGPAGFEVQSLMSRAYTHLDTESMRDRLQVRRGHPFSEIEMEAPKLSESLGCYPAGTSDAWFVTAQDRIVWTYPRCRALTVWIGAECAAAVFIPVEPTAVFSALRQLASNIGAPAKIFTDRTILFGPLVTVSSSFDIQATVAWQKASFRQIQVQRQLTSLGKHLSEKGGVTTMEIAAAFESWRTQKSEDCSYLECYASELADRSVDVTPKSMQLRPVTASYRRRWYWTVGERVNHLAQIYQNSLSRLHSTNQCLPLEEVFRLTTIARLVKGRFGVVRASLLLSPSYWRAETFARKFHRPTAVKHVTDSAQLTVKCRQIMLDFALILVARKMTPPSLTFEQYILWRRFVDTGFHPPQKPVAQPTTSGRSVNGGRWKGRHTLPLNKAKDIGNQSSRCVLHQFIIPPSRRAI
jgi:hypothetical protein